MNIEITDEYVQSKWDRVAGLFTELDNTIFKFCSESEEMLWLLEEEDYIESQLTEISVNKVNEVKEEK